MALHYGYRTMIARGFGGVRARYSNLYLVRWVIAISLVAPLTWLLSTLFWMSGPVTFAASIVIIALANLALLYFFSRRIRIEALKLAVTLGIIVAVSIFAFGLSAVGLIVKLEDIPQLSLELVILLVTFCVILSLQALLVRKSEWQ